MIIIAVVLLGLLVIANAVPLAWAAMLFLGNIGVHLSFWAVLPGAVALYLAKGGGLISLLTNKSN